MAIEKDVLDQLLAGREAKDVFGKDGLVEELKKALSERILNTELVLLRQKVLYFARSLIGAAQHGHRGKFLTSARTSRRRMVGIEFGMCRSGRSGGACGSVTFGNGRRLEHRGGTWC